MNYFAEIIESSLSIARACCWKWDQVPSFGSLVLIESSDIELIGIVSSIQTGSSDPARVPFPYQKTIDTLRKEQPQIFMFLQTILQVNIVGWMDAKKRVYYQLPPRPASMHAFVGDLSFEDAQHFLSKPDFLELLPFFEETMVDEIVLTVLQKAYREKIIEKASIHAVIARYAYYVGSDFKRLRLFCNRLEQVL